MLLRPVTRFLLELRFLFHVFSEQLFLLIRPTFFSGGLWIFRLKLTDKNANNLSIITNSVLCIDDLNFSPWPQHDNHFDLLGVWDGVYIRLPDDLRWRFLYRDGARNIQRQLITGTHCSKKWKRECWFVLNLSSQAYSLCCTFKLIVDCILSLVF